MPRIDVNDEGVIDASPMVVYKAVLNELSGITHWWPMIVYKLRGDIPIDHVGAISDAAAHNRGVTLRASFKVTKIVEAESIETEIAGDLQGTGTWTFEPINGKTKVQYRIDLRTNRLLFSVLSAFVNLGKEHSAEIQKVFKALNSHLSKK
jgi:hypothetical protein